jgi:hypothetical protein
MGAQMRVAASRSSPPLVSKPAVTCPAHRFENLEIVLDDELTIRNAPGSELRHMAWAGHEWSFDGWSLPFNQARERGLPATPPKLAAHEPLGNLFKKLNLYCDQYNPVQDVWATGKLRRVKQITPSSALSMCVYNLFDSQEGSAISLTCCSFGLQPQSPPWSWCCLRHGTS